MPHDTTYIYIYLSITLSINLSLYLSIYHSIYLSISIYLDLYMCVRLGSIHDNRRSACNPDVCEKATAAKMSSPDPAPIVPHVAFVDPLNEWTQDWTRTTTREKEEGTKEEEEVTDRHTHQAYMHAFCTHMALCHSVMLEVDDVAKTSHWSASSPDELALVAGAAYLGYSFSDRSNGSATVRPE